MLLFIGYLFPCLWGHVPWFESDLANFYGKKKQFKTKIKEQKQCLKCSYFSTWVSQNLIPSVTPHRTLPQSICEQSVLLFLCPQFASTLFRPNDNQNVHILPTRLVSKSSVLCMAEAICIECSLCRLIRRPEHLIGRHWYLQANWRLFILWSPDQ
jgi:hypothetical protein